ncbi:cytochrome c peroxidase [Winogradskyella sp.]|jgi:cytochrome c peroxidase|uniref:cytochrome-c peroxidase n=1 Tax=Winogradskyella sp. TaxID=1883156 RepID=UPI0025F6B2A3|nr:cytochrome c peroxidase [Winogradskyella sp.]MCT4630835.1 c-type cytochrome [Winogradskyella sp.]
MRYIAFLIIIGFVFSCNKDETTRSDVYKLQHKGLPAPNLPSDNILTHDGVELGRRLFYEKALSLDNTISCASCHIQEFAFGDPNRFSIGVNGLLGNRQAMGVINLAWNDNEFFWDGRAHLLRDQAVLPIQDPLEMQETIENVIQKLGQLDYINRFNDVFGSEDITEERIGLALEQFMITLVSNNSKYDKVQAGEATFSPSEERGRKLFFDPVNPTDPQNSGAFCVKCHGGPNFANNQYMNNGLDLDEDILDPGRYNVTQNINDTGAFRVPTLRNIELTAPYMHDGRFETLEQVVDHYNNGVQQSAGTDLGLVFIQNGGGLQLTQQEKSDLVAFLKTLTDPTFINNPKYSDPF